MLQEILFGINFLSTLKETLKQPVKWRRRSVTDPVSLVRRSTISFNKIDDWLVWRRVRPPAKIHKREEGSVKTHWWSTPKMFKPPSTMGLIQFNTMDGLDKESG